MCMNLTPTEELVVETLTARARLGEMQWSFDSKLKTRVERLATLGLVSWKYAPIPHVLLVWFTQHGRDLFLTRRYVPPNGLVPAATLLNAVATMLEQDRVVHGENALPAHEFVRRLAQNTTLLAQERPPT